MILSILQLFFDLRVWLVILVLALVEVLFNLGKYYVGRQGLTVVQHRFPKIRPDRLERIETWLENGGAPVLLLMAVPILSTLLSLTAGIYGLRVHTFVSWAYVATTGRNWLLYLLVVGGYYQWR